MSRAQKTIRTVANKLKKASKAHASQAKTLDAIKLKKVVNQELMRLVTVNPCVC